jgi:DNA polymerase-3 subunit delta'
MNHPDLTVIKAEHEGETLKIDQIRELQHSLSLAPYEARYRVALILRFEEAHISASNSMLKTLEEPPEHVVVILTANSAENLLPTIVSRCEVLHLRSLSIEETARGLRVLRDIPDERAQDLAHISDGRPGYALRLNEQPDLLERRRSWLDELIQLLATTQRDRFAFARTAIENKEQLRNELQVWLTFWRDVLICSSGMSRALTNQDYSNQIQNLVKVTDLKSAQFQVNSIEQTIEYINHNVNARQALEVLLIDFPRVNINA